MVPVLVRRWLQIGCLYILVCRLSQGLQQLLIAHLYILVRKHGPLVRRWHQLEFPDIQVAELLSRVRLLLQTECLYRMVYQFSQGQLLHQIAHLYILAGKAESPVRRWHQLEFPCILVVELLSLVQQPLRTGDLYRMAYQPFLVLPKPLIEHLQPLVPAFQVQQSHQLEFPCTLVVELLSRVRLLLQTECLYRLVYQFSQGQLLHQIAHLYILVRKHGSLAHLFLQTGGLHSEQLPS